MRNFLNLRKSPQTPHLCIKKSACPVHALYRSPSKGPFRIHEGTMRPDERIATYMPFGIEMFRRISVERRVALMLH